MAQYKDYQNASLNLFVDQGSSFESTIHLINDVGGPMDLSGHTISIFVKKYYNTTKTFPSLVSILGDPLLGQIKIEIPKETSATFDSERYVYKVVLDATTDPVTVLDGHILIDRF